MIEAIFFDIDGTLVSFKTHKVPLSAAEAVREARRRGVKAFIATGRPLVQVDVLGDLAFDGYIALNGGYCVTDRGETIYENGIPRSSIEALIDYQERVGRFPVAFATRSETFINYVNEEVEAVSRLIEVPPPPVRDIREALETEIFQAMAYFGRDREDEVMKAAFPHCTAARWNPLFTDIIAEGNSKRDGIERVLARYGIDREKVMAFGDGGNDIPMLEYVPFSVAMGNASDEVKAAAGYVTDSVDEDGVRNALKRFGVI